MPVAHANGIDLYHERSGIEGGPRLLVLPGSGADLRRANAGRALEDRFRVLTLDQRGLGQSSVPDGPYSMAQYADDAAALMAAVGWDRAHVLGISFGGMVAQELAIRHPGRVDRLVLACSSAGGAGGASAPLHEYEALPLDEQVAVRLEVLDRRQDAAWRASHPETVQAFRDRLERAATRSAQAKRGGRLQLLARAEHDTWDRLDQIASPTFIAGGRYDGQAPPENQDALRSRIPDARLQFFEGGHGFLGQDPAPYVAIGAFLLE
jgi:3-oxoadipate enol-lactonase